MKTMLAVLLCVAGVSGYAQTPGTFAATGNMDHTANGAHGDSTP